MKLSREQRQQIVDNVRARRADGTCTQRFIEQTAAGAGVSPDYVYRLARAGVSEPTRRPWQLTDQAIELYYRHRAVIPEVHAALAAAGDCPLGLRQLQRAFREQLIWRVVCQCGQVGLARGRWKVGCGRLGGWRSGGAVRDARSG